MPELHIAQHEEADKLVSDDPLALPFHVRWSRPSLVYDNMDLPEDRARVYVQVLQEGTEGEVRHYVQADHLLELWNRLLELWNRLVLPPTVRRAWADWFECHRGIKVGC